MKIEIIAKEGVNKFDDNFLQNLDSDLSFEGSFPNYKLHDGHCMCNYFKSKANWKILTKVINDTVKNNQIKRVKVLKYWSEFPDRTEELKLTVSKFNSLDYNDGLEDNTWYNIIDSSKFDFSV